MFFSNMKGSSFEATALRVSTITLVGNLVLSVFKLFAGVIAHSGAMLSDAVHSASDVLSTVGVMIGVRIAGKAADAEHPYGHERFECIAAVLLAVLLAAVGVGIGKSGAEKLLHPEGLQTPGLLALIASVVSILVKEIMYRYTAAAAKRIGSTALAADAWHHRSDALSSIGALVGIAGARLGLPILDPVASLVICLFILKAAWDIFSDAAGRLVDRGAAPERLDEIRRAILDEAGVLGVDDLKARLFGSRLYVDAEISVDGDLTLRAAHAIAERVHSRVERDIPEVKHCMVHVNPAADLAKNAPL